jgi:glyoxylase-like metal-dependent hydrolase (beta-lactamase superfamily II)
VAEGSIEVNVAAARGHTVGHLIYAVSPLHVRSSDILFQAIFVGDVLFRGGCGGLFELRSASDLIGTQDLFWGSFCQLAAGERLVAEPNVWIYSAHEYSEKMCTDFFVAMMKPEVAAVLHATAPYLLPALAKNLEEVRSLREFRRKGDTVMFPSCTVPSTLLVERATNPLLTLQREQLVRLTRQEKWDKRVNPEAVERAMYLSASRRHID